MVCKDSEVIGCEIERNVAGFSFPSMGEWTLCFEGGGTWRYKAQSLGSGAMQSCHTRRLTDEYKTRR